MRKLCAIVLAACLPVVAGCMPHHPATIRVLTYNIHHGEGTDGAVDLDRIAEVIRVSKADLVALQEVDRGVDRTDRVDEPARLAELTGMHVVFEKNIDYQGGDYGNAVLSRYPIAGHQNHHFPQTRPGEQRGALAAEVRIDRRPVVFIATHLDYHPDDTERLASVAMLRDLMEQKPTAAFVVAGDFNATPDSAVMTAAMGFLGDAWSVMTDEGYTYPAGMPEKRIDYVLFDQRGAWRCTAAEVMNEPEASDHRPLIAVLELQPR